MGMMNKPSIAGNLKAEGAPLWPFNSQAYRDPAQEPQYHLCLLGMLMTIAVVAIYWIHPVFLTMLNSNDLILIIIWATVAPFLQVNRLAHREVSSLSEFIHVQMIRMHYLENRACIHI